MPGVHPQIHPSQVSCPRRVWRRRCCKVAWLIIRFLEKEEILSSPMVTTSLSVETSQGAQQSSWTGAHGWALQAGCIAGPAQGQSYGFPVPYLQHKGCMWRQRWGLRKKQQKHWLKTKLKYYFLSFLLKSFMSAYLLKENSYYDFSGWS